MFTPPKRRRNITLAAAATSSIGSAMAMPTIRTVETMIETCGVPRVGCTRDIISGRLASRAIAKATREDE